MNLERFWRYLPTFYLGALRDIGDEFSPRSQFWGRLLKALEIPADLENRAQRVLDLLNRRLLKADPRLSDIAETLSRATTIGARDREGGLAVRVVPLKSWDLLAKAELVLRNEPERPWLPLKRQGQGIQSLSVIFLFEAFVDHVLQELYETASEPILALEEPETHLHPQAARTLWAHIRSLPGQKVVTTHSPYFLQHVPFRELRLVRLTERGTKVSWLPDTFSVTTPSFEGLDTIVQNSSGVLHYEKTSETLKVRGALSKSTYRKLLAKCGTDDRRHDIERALKDLHDRSSFYVQDSELRAMETFARRMRGEIFFAERWLIVEGQADYLIVQALGRAMQYDLDEHGVSVIDAQNNGQPATFVVLARALDIPWLAVFDGDDAGLGYVEDIKGRGFAEAEVGRRCRTHSAGDLEAQLVADGLRPELLSILTELRILHTTKDNNEVLTRRMRGNKVACAGALADRIDADPGVASRAPAAFRETILSLSGLV